MELCQLDHPPLIETVFDEYVPVTITWPDYHKLLDIPLYVRYEGAGGLLEMKFHPDSSRLIEVVLVNAPGVRREHRCLYPAATHVAVTACLSARSGGLPGLFGKLEVTAFDDYMVLAVESAPPLSWVGTAPVLFGLGESRQVVALCVQWEPSARDLVLMAG
ncbi:hypothetical protein E1218_27535 [Kribbella turkmenica]|uniref:Uncharacterized protein n=1 Tax=Kribbella turkmenica TaxID=2530375 RepID=A0A4R4WF70_9ACTN|nr:hypothetical protein [Kribbella turkmenica]TDD17599.1 hypothetical protein E1218_27535 [Kribbella turkmenica]